MQKSLLALLLIAASATTAVAAETHGDKETLEDIARHRALAGAHESAAKCLESGKKVEACLKELQVACKGLAIGKYCGMKHQH